MVFTLSSGLSSFGGLPGFLSKHLWSFGSDRLHPSSMSCIGATLTSNTMSLGGECLMGGGRRGLMLQDIKNRTGPPGGRPILGAATCLFCRSLFFAARGESHSSPPGFRKTNRNGLLSRTCAMLSLPDVFHLLTDKFPSLSAWGSPFASLCFRALDHVLFRHRVLLSFFKTIPCPLRGVVFLNSVRSSCFARSNFLLCEGLNVLPARLM